MNLNSMPIKLIFKKLIHEADLRDERRFNDRIANHASRLAEYKRIEKIWNEAGESGIFGQIDTESDWNIIRTRMNIPVKEQYQRLPVYNYFLRIAAILIITGGLSIGLYKIIVSVNHVKSNGFVTIQADNSPKEIKLPDASSVTLNAGSRIAYSSGFNDNAREVILNGEALFDVIPDKTRPFKVYTGESVVIVTGTRFTIREEDGSVKVAVLSGTVLLSNTGDHPKQISITANQCGVLMSSNELKVENHIEANTLSWKTGHLVFDQTPIDSALIDIARHFRKELSIETEVTEEITAEFQNQPLREILNEINLVAGLKFDTTASTLIVRK
jgi:ferric-dicitrate binding protein FerR (iron transport regulator)